MEKHSIPFQDVIVIVTFCETPVYVLGDVPKT